MSVDGPWLTREQTAWRYQVTPRTIDRWRRQGLIPPEATLKVGRVRRFNRVLLDVLLAQGQAILMAWLMWLTLLMLAAWSIGCHDPCRVLHRFGIHLSPPPT